MAFELPKLPYAVDALEPYIDAQTMQIHHDNSNQLDPLAHNPFVAHQPEEYSVVDVDEPRCPISPTQLHQFREELAQIPHGQTMHDHRRLWVQAFTICTRLMQYSPA